MGCKEYAALVGQMPTPASLPKLYPHVDWTSLFRKMGELESLDYDWTQEVRALKMQTAQVAELVEPFLAAR